jgi:hypothetical protein
MKILINAILLALLLGGCATPHIPLSRVAFDQAVSVTSEKTAKVWLVPGDVSGSGGLTLVPAGSIALPIPTGPQPHLQFNVEDQRIFVDSFKNELQRLKLFRTALDGDSPESADIGIKLRFTRTYHNRGMQEYTLDVVMEIAGGKKPFLKQYHVISSEYDSWWEKMNTNASEGKTKAGNILIKQLIPDVEAYVAENR